MRNARVMARQKIITEEILAVLITAVILCSFIIIYPAKAQGQDYKMLSPLDEAALKHSPGNLISDELKRSRQFLLLNELLLTDELILKQTRMKDLTYEKEECSCIPDPTELICEQVKVLLKKKEEIVSELAKIAEQTDIGNLKDIDLLIELEIVDDLILVQPQIKDALIELMRLCRSKSFNEIKRLMKTQMEVLIKKKEVILKGLRERLINKH